jgi:hypothetical protein
MFDEFEREADIAAPPADIVNFFRDKIRKESQMQRFWDLLRESVIVQGMITCAFVGTTCYLWATGRPVPQELWTANTVVLGFFFGAKTQQIASRRR